VSFDSIVDSNKNKQDQSQRKQDRELESGKEGGEADRPSEGFTPNDSRNLLEISASTEGGCIPYSIEPVPLFHRESRV